MLALLLLLLLSAFLVLAAGLLGVDFFFLGCKRHMNIITTETQSPTTVGWCLALTVSSSSLSGSDSSEASLFAFFLGGAIFFAGVRCLFCGADFFLLAFALGD